MINHLRRGEIRALSCFQAPLSKISYFLLHLSSTSPCRPLAPSCIMRVCVPFDAAQLASTNPRRSLYFNLCMRYFAPGLSLQDYIYTSLTLALS